MAELTLREAIRATLAEEMRRDPSIFLIGEDIGRYGGAFGVTRGLLDEFGPSRIVETPISEYSIAGVAAGAAMMGMRPVLEFMFMDFIALAMDPLANFAAKVGYVYNGQARVPLVIRAPCGAGRGYGPSHSQSLEPWFVHIPGFSVVCPRGPAEARGLLRSALRADHPVLFLENKLLYDRRGDVPDGEYRLPFGKALVRREGKDLTIASYGRMVDLALEGAQALAARGVFAEVLDLVSLKPLDEEAILASVRKTGRLITVEECHRTLGIGAEIAARAAERALDALRGPVVRLAAEDTPIPCSVELERAMLPDLPKLLAAAEKTMEWG